MAGFRREAIIFFEKMPDIPKVFATVRAQARLSFHFAGFALFSAVDLSPCAYIGSLVDNAKLRADGRRKSPILREILATADPILQTILPCFQLLPGSLPSLPFLFKKHLNHHKMNSVMFSLARELVRWRWKPNGRRGKTRVILTWTGTWYTRGAESWHSVSQAPLPS